MLLPICMTFSSVPEVKLELESVTTTGGEAESVTTTWGEELENSGWGRCRLAPDSLMNATHEECFEQRIIDESCRVLCEEHQCSCFSIQKTGRDYCDDGKVHRRRRTASRYGPSALKKCIVYGPEAPLNPDPTWTSYWKSYIGISQPQPESLCAEMNTMIDVAQAQDFWAAAPCRALRVTMCNEDVRVMMAALVDIRFASTCEDFNAPGSLFGDYSLTSGSFYCDMMLNDVPDGCIQPVPAMCNPCQS